MTKPFTSFVYAKYATLSSGATPTPEDKLAPWVSGVCSINESPPSAPKAACANPT